VRTGKRAIVTAAVLGAGSVLLLSACSSPRASTATTTSGPTTTQVQAAACSPSSVTASVDYTTFGGSATAPAGAVVFTDTASSSCSLRGVPTVQLVGADNQVIPTFEAPATPSHAVTAVLTPKDLLPGKEAASSVTWSSLTCKAGSFSLAIRFPGWSSSVAAGSTAGYSGPPCTAPGQTVYVSPVEPVSSPVSSTTTSSGTSG
jgi:hypothetical protein